MKWLLALTLGVAVGMLVPMIFGGQSGMWLESWMGYGTVRPVAGSPGLLLSIPIALGTALAFRLFFNWHTG